MRLDRNTNSDGSGKYALINLRKLRELRKMPFDWRTKRTWTVPKAAIALGGKDQFFVIKYKDKFAAPALHAYANAVLAECANLENIARSLLPKERKKMLMRAESLREFGLEVFDGARAANRKRNKQIPN